MRKAHAEFHARRGVDLKRRNSNTRKEEVMMDKSEVFAILAADVGDAISTEHVKGKVVGVEHLRDSVGREQVLLLVAPGSAGGKAKETPIPADYECRRGADGYFLYHKETLLGAHLEVVAEVLSPRGDKSLLLASLFEKTDVFGNLWSDRVAFIMHKAFLQEDNRLFLGALVSNGYIIPNKMAGTGTDLLRNYLVKSVPALKAFNISELREHAVRSGWELPGPNTRS